MKKIINLSVLIVTLTISHGFTQSDLRPGFVITNKMDTIYGSINYHEGPQQFKSCEFVRINSEEVTRYTPSEIKGYRFENDKYFESKEIIDEKSGVRNKIFMEVLVKGTATLFKSLKSTYYIEKGDSAFYRLSNDVNEVLIDGKIYYKNSLQYIKIMNFLFSDCGDLSLKIQNIKFEQKDLTKLIEQYNECGGGKSVSFKANKPWTKLDLGVLFGMAHSSIKVEKVPGDFIYLADSYSSVDPLFGIVLGISSPRIAERIALQTELHFIKTSYYSLVEISDFANTAYFDTYIDISTVSLPISIKYYFLGRKLSFFFQGGINFDFNISTNTEVIGELVRVAANGYTVETVEGEAFEINKSQLGYWGGIGIIKRLSNFNVSADVRYTMMTKLNLTDEFSSNNNRLTLSIIISKK